MSWLLLQQVHHLLLGNKEIQLDIYNSNLHLVLILLKRNNTNEEIQVLVANEL